MGPGYYEPAVSDFGRYSRNKGSLLDSYDRKAPSGNVVPRMSAPSIPSKFLGPVIDPGKIDLDRMIVIVNDKCNLTKLI